MTLASELMDSQWLPSDNGVSYTKALPLEKMVITTNMWHLEVGRTEKPHDE